MNKETLVKEILRLKEEKNAIILAHYYTLPEIQEICDFLGDSLELSKKAASCDASIIVFCGVQFMAETAAILAPEKKVLIPIDNAGCSLADGATGVQVRGWKKLNPSGVVVSYVNTTADVKAETDICCTSSNARRVIESLPEDTKIVFVPDVHLGSYLKALMPKRDITVWNSDCCVHHPITSALVLHKLKKYPEADVLIHPESACSDDPEIINHPSCYFYSTSGIIKHAQESPKKQFLVATELGIFHQLEKLCPGKEFIPVDVDAVCYSMKLNTLETLYECLRDEKFQVEVPKELREKSLLPIQRMMEI